MKTIYRTAALAVALILSLTSCRNAGAQNDKNTDVKAASVKELSTEAFNKTIYDMNAEGQTFLGDKPAMVDFTATWCGPCRGIAPVLEELAKEYAGEIDIYKVDVDKNRDLVRAFNISSIPAILYIPLTGEPVMTVGSRDKNKFKSEIETILLKK